MSGPDRRADVDALQALQLRLDGVQARLDEAEARLQRVLQGAGEGWWDWNLATGERYCSPRGLQMVGRHADETVADADLWRRLIHPDDQRRVEEVFVHALRSGATQITHELRLLHVDGHAVPVLVRGHLQRGRDGRAQRFSGTVTDLSPLREAEEQRRDLQHGFEALFENSLDGMLQTRPDGAVVNANAAACRMLGYTLEEIRRSTRDQLMDTDDPRLAPLLDERRLAGRVRGEVRMRRASGETFEVEIASSIYVDGAGRPVGSAVFRDVTERREWAARLEASVSLLDNLSRHVPGVIYQFRLDPDGRSCFPFASAGLRDIYELEPEDVAGDAEPVFRRLHPDDFAAVTAAISRSARTLEPWVQEFRVLLPRQGLRWRQGQAQPERLPDGGVLWHGFITDITERKHAEAKLQRLNRALRVLAGHNVTPRPGDDEVAYLRQVCEAAVQAGGYRTGWIGCAQDDAERSVRIVAHAGTDAAWVEQLRVSWDPENPLSRGPTGRAIASGRTQVNAHWLSDPRIEPWREAARQRGLRSCIALPLVTGGHTIGSLTLFADEPEAFAADEVGPLEEYARHVGLGIEAIRAREARIAAEDASRAKSAFLANMSHEIRTPLNAIIGLGYLLRQDGLTPRQVERLEVMQRSGQHLLGLIDDILDLSKIEAGEVRLLGADFSLAELLDHVRESVDAQARAKGLFVVVDNRAGALRLHGDAMRLRQVLLNYAGNAVKFTEAGGVCLRVLEPRIESGRARLRFEVEDTGPGVPPEQRERLFRPFVQADESITRRYGGTGLGLAIARRLALLMNGEVGVDGPPDGGSRFWFTAWLALAGSAAPDAAATGSPAEAARAPAPSATELALGQRHRGALVLVAEDNPVNRDVARAMLERVGLTVLTADDGAEAVAHAATQVPALVLMDLQMPHVDGLEATRQLRRAGLRVPVIALTANARAEDRDAALESGMDDYVAKPMDVTLLYDKLLRWLDAGAERP